MNNYGQKRKTDLGEEKFSTNRLPASAFSDHLADSDLAQSRAFTQAYRVDRGSGIWLITFIGRR
jgi:hypothetical protein